MARTVATGIVIKGNQRGRTLGYPTANLQLDDPQKVLGTMQGIWASYTKVGKKIYKSVTSYGKAPTFNDQEIKVETYIFDFDQDIYFERIEVEFVYFLRKVKNFSSVEELKLQMAKDVQEAKRQLSWNRSNLKF